MKKDTIIGAVALVVIVLGIVAYAALRPAPAGAPSGVATSTSPASLTLPEGSYSDHAAYYTIDANYATSTPLAGAANAAAVATMKQFVADTITQFKTDGNFDHLSANDIKMMGFDQGNKETLKILYLVGSSAHTISYIYTTYTDTLGAHGNTDFTTFVFDKDTGAKLALGDLFLPGVDYLTTISKLARARLPEVIGPDFDINAIKDGTTPTEDNFKDFFFDGTDFVVLFPPYQVAAYSEGPQTLRIPTNIIASVLKAQYR